MLSERIKAARKKKGLTLKQLGSKIGLSHAALSKIESGKSHPTRQTLIALSRVLEDDFDLPWLAEIATVSGLSKSEIAQEMTVGEFISLKFGDADVRRTHAELDMLAKLLEREIERLKSEGY